MVKCSCTSLPCSCAGDLSPRQPLKPFFQCPSFMPYHPSHGSRLRVRDGDICCALLRLGLLQHGVGTVKSPMSLLCMRGSVVWTMSV